MFLQPVYGQSEHYLSARPSALARRSDHNSFVRDFFLVFFVSFFRPQLHLVDVQLLMCPLGDCVMAVLLG